MLDLRALHRNDLYIEKIHHLCNTPHALSCIYRKTLLLHNYNATNTNYKVIYKYIYTPTLNTTASNHTMRLLKRKIFQLKRPLYRRKKTKLKIHIMK